MITAPTVPQRTRYPAERKAVQRWLRVLRKRDSGLRDGQNTEFGLGSRMSFLRHILRLFVAMLFSALGASMVFAVPLMTSDITYFQAETTLFAQADNVGFTARAPPTAMSNVAATGGTTVMQGSAFALDEQETVAVFFGFDADHFATNTGPRFISRSDGQTLDTSRISVPGPTNAGEGKTGFLLGRVDDAGGKSAQRATVFRDKLGFDDDTLSVGLNRHLQDNFASGTACPSTARPPTI